MEDPDLLMEQLNANIQLVSKKSARVATLELFRSLSRYSIEYAPGPAFAAIIDACLKRKQLFYDDFEVLSRNKSRTLGTIPSESQAPPCFGLQFRPL
jgi:hypothetical protein